MSAVMPTLDSVLRDPGSVDSLSRDAITTLLAETASVQSTLTCALLTANGASPAAASNGAAVQPDKWLTADEACAHLRKKRRWLYRHKNLPFVRRTGRTLLCNQNGIRRWLEKQK